MNTKRAFSIFFIVVFATTLFAQDSINIGFSLGDFHVDRWYKDRNYFVENANSLGARVHCEYAYGDAEKQIEQVHKLIDSGIKVIMIVPTDASVFNEITDKAHKSGVKIISYDRLITGADIDYYISFDNRKVGKQQATYAVKNRPKGNYVLLAGPKKDNNAIEFLKGQKEVLQPSIDKGDINVLLEKHLAEWSSMDAFLELQTFFEENGTQIDAVIASNDMVATGVLMAFDMFVGDFDIVLTGQDANADAVKNIYLEKQSMTVYKPIMKLAKAAAKMSVDLAKGKDIDMHGTTHNGFKEVPSILLEPIVVTKDNIKETVIADGYYTESEIFGE